MNETLEQRKIHLVKMIFSCSNWRDLPQCLESEAKQLREELTMPKVLSEQIQKLVDELWDEHSQIVPCNTACGRKLEENLKKITLLLGVEKRE